LKRNEAITVLKELLECCEGLDGHILQLEAPFSSSEDSGYQIIIKLAIDEKTQKCILEILANHNLSYQAGNIWKTKHSINKVGSDTFIIYRHKNQIS
jgi:hypothetical protein